MANAAEEAYDPARDLPLGIVGSLGKHFDASITGWAGYMPSTASRGSMLALTAGAACSQLAHAAAWQVPATHPRPALLPCRVRAGIATVLYVLMGLCLVLMVSYSQIDRHAPFSAAFLQAGMPWAAKVVSLGAVMGERGAGRDSGSAWCWRSRRGCLQRLPALSACREGRYCVVPCAAHHTI